MACNVLVFALLNYRHKKCYGQFNEFKKKTKKKKTTTIETNFDWCGEKRSILSE